MRLVCSWLLHYGIRMSDCAACVVRNTAICAALSAPELAALSQIGRTRRLVAGESLVWEGDDAIMVANVIAGVLKLTTGLGDGREQIVGLVYPADFIGRPFGQTAQSTVTALTDAQICAFARADFDRFARAHPALEHKLLERTLDELDRARQWMLLLGRKTAAERVASFLLDMAERLARGGGTDAGSARQFDLPFGRQQIADVLGTTIETVSRQLTVLKQRGIIALPGRRTVSILDHDALVARSG